MEQTVVNGMETIISNVGDLISAVVTNFGALMANNYFQMVFAIGLTGSVLGLIGAAKNSVR